MVPVRGGMDRCTNIKEKGMISNQILLSTIEGLKGITRVDLSVIDVDGKVLASTFKETIDYHEAAAGFTQSPADSQEISTSGWKAAGKK